jgi:hypothetical protein
MNKQKLLLVFAVLFCITALVACNKIPKQETGITESNSLNSSYVIENSLVKLENGLSEVAIASDSATKIETSVWGKPVSGDLNGDELDDAALILIQNPGGSGTFYYIGANMFDSINKKYTGTNALLLGDRILPENISVEKGEIIVKYKERKNDEPMTQTPSVEVLKKYWVENGMLKEILN